ncbi:MepB family protein [Priestia megaterium]|nr:MepB family protein [Priestia megaterium]
MLKTDTTQGIMAIRVYPIWDKPSSNHAMDTQKWHLEYFIEANNLSYPKFLKLYS